VPMTFCEDSMGLEWAFIGPRSNAMAHKKTRPGRNRAVRETDVWQNLEDRAFAGRARRNSAGSGWLCVRSGSGREGCWSHWP
jgi:hypothetical protein